MNVFFKQPQQALSTSASPAPSFKHSPNGQSSQQSRRGSSFEPPQRRVSQQSFTESIENAGATIDSSDKYLQDSYETEKPRSNRTSPNAEDSQYQTNGTRRKGSIRFYDEIQSIDEANKTRDETGSVVQQDDSAYASSGYEYKESVPEYNQTNQSANEVQQQPDQMYSQLDYTNQPYGTTDYESTQYVDQQNYDQNQYGTSGNSQPTDEYAYQSEYQGYDLQGYQSAEQLQQQQQQPEQYSTGMYQESNTKPNYDTSTYQPAQQQPSYTEPIPTNTNVGQKYKGNGNTAISGQRQQPMSKQPAKKKFT